MNRDQKAQVVDEIAGELERAEAIFAVDYRGISVSDVADLRAKLREADAVFRVVKNSLTERAADKAGTAELKELLDGPTALTLVSGDPALAAKALSDTARALHILDFKGGLMNGNALTADEIRSIARLPSREVLHGQLVGTIAAPLSGLVRTLNALVSGLAVQLQQIADQGLVGASPTSEATGDDAQTTADSEATRVASDAEEAPHEEQEPEAAEPEPEAAPDPQPEAEQPTEPEPEETPSDGESDAKEE